MLLPALPCGRPRHTTGQFTTLETTDGDSALVHLDCLADRSRLLANILEDCGHAPEIIGVDMTSAELQAFLRLIYLDARFPVTVPDVPGLLRAMAFFQATPDTYLLVDAFLAHTAKPPFPILTHVDVMHNYRYLPRSWAKHRGAREARDNPPARNSLVDLGRCVPVDPLAYKVPHLVHHLRRLGLQVPRKIKQHLADALIVYTREALVAALHPHTLDDLRAVYTDISDACKYVSTVARFVLTVHGKIMELRGGVYVDRVKAVIPEVYISRALQLRLPMWRGANLGYFMHLAEAQRYRLRIAELFLDLGPTVEGVMAASGIVV